MMLSKLAVSRFVRAEFLGTSLDVDNGACNAENFCSWQGEQLQRRDECHLETGRRLLQSCDIL